MALSVLSMKTAIINAFKSGADNASNANKKFGDAILKNICDNISITYGWSAALTSHPFTIDPVASFSASVSGGGTLAPSGSFSSMLVKLATLIKGLTISAGGFTVSPLVFNPAGALSATMAKEDTQDAAITALCTQIITSIKSSFVNPAPAFGSHGPYVGATTIMVIQ